MTEKQETKQITKLAAQSTRSHTLYELSEAWGKTLAEIDSYAQEHDGEIKESLLEKLGAVQESVDEKINNCLSYYKNQLALADSIKLETMNLRLRETAIRENAEKMKNYIHGFLQHHSINKWENAKHAISFRKSMVLDIYCGIDDIEKDFIRVKVTKEFDKPSIKNAMKKGQSIAGCELIEKNNLIIK